MKVLNFLQLMFSLSPQQKGSREKLCNGTGCLCLSPLLEILLSLLCRVYIKLLPTMENVFILMVLVSASVTVSSKFLGKSENDIVVGI